MNIDYNTDCFLCSFHLLDGKGIGAGMLYMRVII